MLEAALSSKLSAGSIYTVEDGKWIVESAATTSKEFSDSLKLPDTVSFFIVPVTGYFGLAQPDLWEWIAAKIAAKTVARAS